jgi:DNA invertase Pin-like site-specific DNA recombinase
MLRVMNERRIPRAISYIRFSTPSQAMGDSLRRQLERTKDYCDRHGLTLDETLRDEGLSGYKGEHTRRGALGRFLAAVEAGRVPHGTVLIIEHLDRFSRQNPRISLTMLLDLINAGVRVVTLFNEHVYSDVSKTIEHDLIGAILYMSEAHNASLRKADLIREKWNGKRQSIATGERKALTRVCPAWLAWDERRQKFVPTSGARTVRRIYEWAASGLSSNAIYKRLNAKGVPTLTGNKVSHKTGQSISNGWNSARVLEIVKSDGPLGWFQPHKRDGKMRVPIGEPIKDYYPASFRRSWRIGHDIRWRSVRSVAKGQAAMAQSLTCSVACVIAVCVVRRFISTTTASSVRKAASHGFTLAISAAPVACAGWAVATTPAFRMTSSSGSLSS